MARITKMIEVVARSGKSWEDALRCALDEANKSVLQIRSINAREFNVLVADGKITEYEVTARISFEVERE